MAYRQTPDSMSSLSLFLTVFIGFLATGAYGTYSRTVEELTSAQLSCPSGQVIFIRKATWGKGGCGSGPREVTWVLGVVCDTHHTCDVTASDDELGDTCVGQTKELSISYECVSDQIIQCSHPGSNAKFYEGPSQTHTFDLYCYTGENVVIWNALWGLGNCQKDVTDVVQKLCPCNSHCGGHVNNDALGGDPCVGAVKYLSIDYECHKGPCRNLIEVTEGEPPVNFGCRGGEKMNILSAYYGHENCGKSVITQAMDICQGKETCKLEASNGLFGDPCFSETKTLSVRYTCGASSARAKRGITRGCKLAWNGLSARSRILYQMCRLRCASQNYDTAASRASCLSGCVIFNWIPI